MQDHYITAIKAALEAGNAINEIYQRPFEVEIKADNSPLTEADQKANAIINTYLEPTAIPIISEENKQIDYADRKDWQNCWIVDPLDGTSDFVSKSGEFTIMIALVDKHEPILGVIYWPTNDILYVAQKGGGAHKFVTGVWEKLTISKRSEPHNCRALGSRHH
ncbi:3'(2'),5'-bisphosphate nucleotidase CysQ, partial [Gilvibacter sp.]|uniref:3'(2'),5'-bisphosphate nucleotidase CysQ n=1 Tax=Gilvibacter sp. TaxID=2729997 RepID=UPI0035BE2EEA